MDFLLYPEREFDVWWWCPWHAAETEEITFITSRHEASVGHTLTWTMYLTASLQITVQIRATFCNNNNTYSVEELVIRDSRSPLHQLSVLRSK